MVDSGIVLSQVLKVLRQNDREVISRETTCRLGLGDRLFVPEQIFSSSLVLCWVSFRLQ